MSELTCSTHKGYRGLRKPRSGCEECQKIYETNRELNVRESRAPRTQKKKQAEAPAFPVADAVVDTESPAVDPDGPAVDDEVAVDPSACCDDDEVEVSEATYDDVLNKFNPREG
jgi:hypothetical protein